MGPFTTLHYPSLRVPTVCCLHTHCCNTGPYEGLKIWGAFLKISDSQPFEGETFASIPAEICEYECPRYNSCSDSSAMQCYRYLKITWCKIELQKSGGILEIGTSFYLYGHFIGFVLFLSEMKPCGRCMFKEILGHFWRKNTMRHFFLIDRLN